MRPILIAISPGELADRLTILALKVGHSAGARRAALEAQRAALAGLAAEALGDGPDVAALVAELATVNGRLWEIEDALRVREAAQDFDAGFVALARSVYCENDRRAGLKRAIDDRLGSALREEKIYR